jgi:hypothetical protein
VTPIAPDHSPNHTAAQLPRPYQELLFENLMLRGRIIGALENQIQGYQSMIQEAQIQLDREKTIVRLLVRQQANILTPEEQSQLEELRRLS